MLLKQEDIDTANWAELAVTVMLEGGIKFYWFTNIGQTSLDYPGFSPLA